MQWIVEHDHVGLLQLVADSVTNPLSKKQQTYFLLESATTYHPKVFDIIINRFMYPGIDLSMAIVAAANGGYMDIVERLLAVGADVDPKPHYGSGRTALQAASEGGHLKVVERLLATKANANAKPANEGGGRTALQAAS